MINYNEYLFSCLLKLYDTEFEQMEYDRQFDQIFKRYIEFESSEFNVEDKSEYMCILDYLESKYSVSENGTITKN